VKKCLLMFVIILFVSTPHLLFAEDSKPQGSSFESSSHVLLGKVFKTFKQDEWAENEFQTAVKLNDNKEAYRELATIYSERAAKGNQAPSVKQMYQKQAQEMALKAEGKRDAAKERPKLTQSRIEPYQVQRDMFGRDVKQLERERAIREREEQKEHEEWLKKYNAKSKRLSKRSSKGSGRGIPTFEGVFDENDNRLTPTKMSYQEFANSPYSKKEYTPGQPSVSAVNFNVTDGSVEVYTD